jgi:hypothetical protein
LTFNNFNLITSTGASSTAVQLQNNTAQMQIIVPTSGGSNIQFYKDNSPTYVGAIGTYNPLNNTAQSAIIFSDYQGSWTERMRLNSSGYLGIGTSNPSQLLHLNVSSGSVYEQISSGANNVYVGYDSGRTASAIQSNNALVFDVGSTYTQRMVIDTSGNLGLGVTPSAWSSAYKVLELSYGVFGSENTTVGQAVVANNCYNTGTGISPAWKYKFGGAPTLYESGEGSHKWYKASTGTAGTAITFTQAMTLDSGGNLLVGKTSSSGTTIGSELRADGSVWAGMSASTNATSTLNVYSTGASAYRFYVGMGGTIYATSIVITAISDQRLKENVRDIDTGLSAIMELKPRRFDWKDGKGQDKKNVAGFIAQEFETVFPECVSTSMAGADGIEYKNINHETLIPTLVKAMQELSAQVTELKAEVAKLKGA